MNRSLTIKFVIFASLVLARESRAEIVEYLFGGSVSKKTDPSGYFPDISIGNSINGLLRYDDEVAGLGSQNAFAYQHPSPFLGLAFRVNGRHFQSDPYAAEDQVFTAFVLNDFPPILVPSPDQIIFDQLALLPLGVTGEDPKIAVEFGGPQTAIPDASLPSEIQLDAWTSATIRFETATTKIEGNANSLQPLPAGDFNFNGILDARDIDILSLIAGGLTNRFLFDFDLDDNHIVDMNDRTVWVEQLKYTYFGDSNLDGEFNSTDFVFVFQAGQYEDGIDQNSGWATGDWDGDRDFGSSDFVLAFQTNGFEKGPRVALVPEPCHRIWILLVLFGLHKNCKRSQRPS